MAHNEQNISGYHSGDALEITVTVNQGGEPLNITDASAEWLLKENVEDGDVDAIVKKTVNGGGITISDAANGEIVIHIETGDTAGEVGEYHHLCRLTDANDRRATIFHGNFTIDE